MSGDGAGVNQKPEVAIEFAECEMQLLPSACAYVVAVLGAFLIVAGLVWVMRIYTRPAPLGEDRAAIRRKTLAEVRNADAEVLNNPNYVWQDQPKGIVRMPIKDAMELVAPALAEPGGGPFQSVARVEKKYYVPPPPPNKFE